ncbi:hypothetical protein AVMA1855_03830 [Acidovorax sp. SUPP1855]|uniref:hypothetical protein n=1 Tax=Acidovorax sp. SUPP1855 TaxID=431774 RepID=UPI0023DE456A|nr:hypothetical protein [Acidovorax sp. SUPP1855]GKS83240.1 hypothetical protein AVMA1855_03830 [Acidovorax sp. SUPP1855]
MTFRVTHIDMHHRRRRLVVRNVCNRAAALAWVEQMYGQAWYLAAMHQIEGN